MCVTGEKECFIACLFIFDSACCTGKISLVPESVGEKCATNRVDFPTFSFVRGRKMGTGLETVIYEGTGARKRAENS